MSAVLIARPKGISNQQGMTFPVSYAATEIAVSPDPTRATYNGLTAAYDYFNAQLFGGKLPHCLVTLQRKGGSYGYFSEERFGTRDRSEITDEIALNPRHFRDRTPRENLSTLVHQMCHLEQFHFGTPSRKGHHNREWGMLMERVGLVPSATGAPGGRRTGAKMSHYVLEDGPFVRACAELEARGIDIRYVDLADDPEITRRNKIKVTCPSCGQNAWGRPGLNLICGECHLRLA